MEESQAEVDRQRDEYLQSLGFTVLRHSRDVFKDTDAVVEVIYGTMVRNLKENCESLNSPISFGLEPLAPC
jgi:very-short-patch-repair endonuclease